MSFPIPSTPIDLVLVVVIVLKIPFMKNCKNQHNLRPNILVHGPTKAKVAQIFYQNPLGRKKYQYLDNK